MIRYDMDEQFPGPITRGLQSRGIDCLTVQDDGRDGLADAAVLDRAAELGRVVVSCDDDMLRETSRRTNRGESFAGLIYGHQLKLVIGRTIAELAFLAQHGSEGDFTDTVWRLPL